MRRPPELLSAFEFAVSQSIGKPDPHYVRAALLSVVIKRPSSSPAEVMEAKRECLRELLMLTGGKAAV
ncbi:MAG: hypothetical protein BGP20_11665 [Thiobacillus sp. 63-78]|uniref:hypothetical protein n=1 Tax=Thiobacillus sp. 63-78 TaxID=1895859 RepID=UPI0009659483|nr:hypothetical protein [Thiobacillus sp. 63-78]OJZ12390.1 MAG: hypothetical protein BGP20_11665 [Thiobacillus sp. 63-78]